MLDRPIRVKDQRLQRRHPNVVRGGGSDALSEGVRMRPMAKARMTPVEATGVGAKAWAKVILDEGSESRGTSCRAAVPGRGLQTGSR